MKVQQIFTGCLARGTYYIESEGEAAIVDARPISTLYGSFIGGLLFSMLKKEKSRNV
jgi:hypothetical protein